MKQADRYTVLDTNFERLPELLRACRLLGLTFIVIGDPAYPYHEECLLYIFFDTIGLNCWMAGEYKAETACDLTNSPT